MMHVAIGSNIDPHIHVPAALDRLDRAYGLAAASPFYRVPALDRPDQADFWNGVAHIQADATPDELRAIEAAEGRVREADKWAARTLDLDILLHDGRIVDEDLHTRPFLARCLADLDALPPGVPEPTEDWPLAQTEH